MKVTFVEHKYKMAKRFKDVMTEKLAKLDKYFNETASARVVCSKQEKQEKMDRISDPDAFVSPGSSRLRARTSDAGTAGSGDPGADHWCGAQLNYFSCSAGS